MPVPPNNTDLYQPHVTGSPDSLYANPQDATPGYEFQSIPSFITHGPTTQPPLIALQALERTRNDNSNSDQISCDGRAVRDIVVKVQHLAAGVEACS